jgi:hypothetical protein
VITEKLRRIYLLISLSACQVLFLIAIASSRTDYIKATHKIETYEAATHTPTSTFTPTDTFTPTFTPTYTPSPTYTPTLLIRTGLCEARVIRNQVNIKKHPDSPVDVRFLYSGQQVAIVGKLSNNQWYQIYIEFPQTDYYWIKAEDVNLLEPDCSIKDVS